MAVQADTVVQRVEVEDATQQGANSAIQNLEKVATGAEKMSGAVQGTSNAFAAFDRAAGNSSRTLDRWRARADENERALQTLIRAENDYNRAIRTGQATVEEKTRVLDQLWKQTIGAADAANQNAIALERERQAADASQRAFNDLLGVNRAVTASAKASAAVFEEQARAEEDAARQAKQLEAANDALRSKYVPLHAVQQQYLAALRDIRTAGPEVFRSETERAAALQRTKDAFAAQVVAIRSATVAQTQAAAVVTSSARSYGGMGNIIQQSGYQIGDFAVQVASGQSAVRAFTQQGVQLVSMFGPWGAVVGAAGAVVGALATAFIDQDSAVNQNTQALDDYNRIVAQTKELSLEAAGAVRDLENAHKDAGIAALESGLAGAVAAQDQLQRQLRVQQDYVEALRAGVDGGGMAASGDELRQAERDLADMTDRFDRNSDAIDGMNSRLFVLRDSLGKVTTQTDVVTNSTAALTGEYDSHIDLWDKHREGLSEANKELLDQIDIQKQYGQALLQGGEALDDFRDAEEAFALARRLNIDTSSKEFEQLADLVIKKNEVVRANEAIKESQDAAAKAAEESAREQRRAAEQIERAYEKTFERIRDFSEASLGDSFYDLLRGETVDFAEFLETTLIRALANVAAAAATQTIVMPIATQVVGLSPGLFGLPASAVPANQNGGVVGSIFGGQGGFNPLSVLNGVGDTITQGIGGIVSSIFPAQSAAAGASIFGAEAGIAAQGAMSAAGGAQLLSSFAGPAALAALAATMAYQMGFIGPGPTSGPVGVADFSPGLGRDLQFGPNSVNPMEFLTADNGGNPEGMRPIAEAIADLIADNAERFSATIDSSLRFRVANYASPEDGNSHDRVQGFEVNAFIRGEAERRIAEGLDQTQAIFEAFNYAVKEAFTFESDTLQEIARNTSATTTEELLSDLAFGKYFDDLRAELTSLGGEINQNTLAQAQNTLAIEEQAQLAAEEAISPILSGLQKAIELFPARTGAVDAVNDNTAFSINDVIGTDEGSRVTTGYEVVDAATGDLLATYERQADAIAEVNRLAAERAAALNSESGAVARTAEELARYQQNLERVDFAIGLTRIEVENLVDTISGAFEPETLGPYATALASGRAELEALREHLNAVNDEITAANAAFPELQASLIDVTATIEQATTTLLATLQEDFQQSIEAQINTARGNEFLTTVQTLLDTRDAVGAEAAALGLNVNDTAGELFSAQLSNLIDDLTADQLNQILQNFDDAALTGAVQDMIDALNTATADETQTILQTLATQELIDAELELIASRREEAAEAERLADAAGRNARTLRSSADSLLVDTNLSPLSVEDRMNEALSQFDEALTLANDDDPTDLLSQEAIQSLPSLGRSALQAAKEFYGSSTQYDQRFNYIQGALLDTAISQESVEQQQLSVLREIESLLEAQGASGNSQPLYVSAGNGQYVSTGAGGLQAGLDLGVNAEDNIKIARALALAGIAFPGAGEGQIGALRQSNSRAHDIISALGFANGGAFWNGEIIPFANGGVFGTPTLFPIGVMGEAGPEAIMPLERGADGRLGVVVHGGGGGEGMAAVAQAIGRLDARLAAIEANTGKQAQIADRESARPKVQAGRR